MDEDSLTQVGVLLRERNALSELRCILMQAFGSTPDLRERQAVICAH